MVILQEGVHDVPGRVHFARQDVRHGGQAVDAHVSGPYHRVDVILIKEIQLEGAGRVEQHNDLFERPLFLERLQIFKQVHFFLAQTEIVAVRHIGFQLGQTGGQVRTFSGGTGQHDQRCIAIAGKGGFQRIGIFVPWHLVDAILGGISAGEGGVFPLIAAGDIEFPQVSVDAPGLEAVLQRGVQAGSLAGGDKGGAGAHLHGIDRGLRKTRNFRIRGQGKGAVPVQ